MINLTTILQIGGLFLIAMYHINKCEKLENENEELRDRIKSANEWFDYEREFIKESAILGERLRVSNEEFMKTCEEFHKQCEVIKHE